MDLIPFKTLGDKIRVIGFILFAGPIVGMGLWSLFQVGQEEQLAVGAPSTEVSFYKHLIPFTDSTYDLGTSTKAWRTAYIDELCLTADTCETTWPEGGPGGGGQSNWYATSSTAITPTTTVGIRVNASSTIGAGGQASGLTIFGGATTTGNAYIVGNVGIGTSSPLTKLHVSGGGVLVDNGQYYQLRRSTGAININALGFESGTDNLILRTGGASAGNRFGIMNTGSTEMFTILNSGLIGVGTTAPAYSLDTYNSNGAILGRFKDTDSTHAGVVISGDTNGGYVGNMNIGTGVGEGFYLQNSTNAIRMYTNSTEKARLTSTGLFGIGTSTPTRTLDVNGDIRGANFTATGTATIGTLDGLIKGTSGVLSAATAGTDYETSLTAGDGLTRTLNDFDCDTASVSVFGCLASADFTTFMGKVATSSIDTVGELETLTGVNLVVSTEIDTIGEIETLAAGVNIIVGTEIDTSSEIATLVTDETGTAGNLVFSTSPLLAGFRSNASSTIGGGTAVTGLTINGYATTTGLLVTTGGATTTLLKVLTDLSLPYSTNETQGVNGDIGVDSTSNQVKFTSNGSQMVLGNGTTTASFTYSTTTAWTGTTTLGLGPAPWAETWRAVRCFTGAGTVNVDFGDGTNWTNATTTGANNPAPQHLFSTNNTFTAGEQRFVRMGTPASSPTYVSCTVYRSITPD